MSSMVSFAGESHPGLVRQNNEDYFVLDNRQDAGAILAAVADGLGGHPCGEVASRFTCETLHRDFSNKRKSLSGADTAVNFLRDSVSQINRALFTRSRTMMLPVPMGCTIAAMILFEDEAAIIWCGDSRIYEYDADRQALTLLSRDHVVTQDRTRRENNFLLQAVGVNWNLAADAAIYPRKEGNRYLICSDGLTRYASDDVIAEIMSQETDPHRTAGLLIRQALMGGGGDNVTVIVS